MKHINHFLTMHCYFAELANWEPNGSIEAQTTSRNSGNGSMKVTYGEDGILE
jgi:hypothetical protein